MQGFLAEHEYETDELVNATKTRFDRDGALEIAAEVDEIVVAKGKKVTRFDLKNDPPDEDTLVKHLLGPTGNLRAPTLRVGKRLFVGFNEEAVSEFFEEVR